VDSGRSDIDLVTAIANGEHGAVGELYDRYAPLLLAIGVQRLRDRGVAEEVVHDVFLEAWRTADRFDPGRGSVRTWLVMRMRSRALDRCRSAGWARRAELPPDHPAPWEEGEGSGDRERVQAALGTLPPEQRVVMALGYYEGLSCVEIADRIGVPVGTVKSRTAAALGKLRAALSPGEPR
jgi:RNA polymerase sigma-70 factor (ECF subfamily)